MSPVVQLTSTATGLVTYTMVAAILAAIVIIAMGLRPQYLVLKRCH